MERTTGKRHGAAGSYARPGAAPAQRVHGLRTQGDARGHEVQRVRELHFGCRDRYWYEDHVFGVVMIYDGCDLDTEEIGAYLLIKHEFEDMEWAWKTPTYTTHNRDVVTVDAVRFSLEFWYNPVDLELMVVPHQDNQELGLQRPQSFSKAVQTRVPQRLHTDAPTTQTFKTVACTVC